MALCRPMPQAVVRVRKMSAEQDITQTTADLFTNLFFTLTQADFAEHRDSYQQYMIEHVEVWFRPTFRANPAAAVVIYNMPLIYVAVDPNDTSSWTTLAEAQSAENAIVMDDSEAFMVAFKPFVSLAADKNALTALASVDVPLWVDTFNNDVRYRGLKIAVSGDGAATASQTWVVNFRITAVFRMGK